MTRFLGRLSVAIALCGVLACGEEETGQPTPSVLDASLLSTDLGLPPAHGGILRPDILIDSMIAAPNMCTFCSHSVRVAMRNAGPGDVPAVLSEPWRLRIYLSTDIYHRLDDALVHNQWSTYGSWDVGPHSVDVTVYVPSNQAPGLYYLFAIADYGNKRTETNEWNNVGLKLVGITSH